VVAQYAMLLTVAHRHQAVMMAPTEVLARQHYETLFRSLHDSRVRLGLLTGSLTAAERRRVLEATNKGEIDVLVGTQALLDDSVRFANLGLVVIDEQHKFGVSQRAVLRQGGISPHYLVLSATPIPRTLAMAAGLQRIARGTARRRTIRRYGGLSWWQYRRRPCRPGERY